MEKISIFETSIIKKNTTEINYSTKDFLNFYQNCVPIDIHKLDFSYLILAVSGAAQPLPGRHK